MIKKDTIFPVVQQWADMAVETTKLNCIIPDFGVSQSPLLV